MQEFSTKINTNLIQNMQLAYSTNKLQRKFSIDVQEGLNGQIPNCLSFSNVNDQLFLNSGPSFSSFNSNEQIPFYVPDNYVCCQLSEPLKETPYCTSPSTPNSFGFQTSPFHWADIKIQLPNQEQELYQNVELYLVYDITNPKKAGLVFKTKSQKQIDLRIEKAYGRQLQISGYIEVSCELWTEETGEWTEVQVQIKLIQKKSFRS